MNHPTATVPSSERSLWLELRFRQQVRRFELSCDDERAIVVGASPRAHLRVDAPGVAPVAFHFERDAAGVCVVPGYQSNVRVNSMPVRTRSRLPSRAVIELCGVELDVTLLEECIDGASDSVEELGTTEHVRAYALDQALEANTVRFSVPGLDPSPIDLATSTLELPTRVLRRDALEPEAAPPKLPFDFLERTLVIERPRVETPPPSTELFERTLALQIQPPPSIPSSLEEVTTAFEAIRAVSQAPASTTSPGIEAPKPIARRRPARWLTRLGLITKARPLLVSGAASVSALALGAALALVVPGPDPHPAPSKTATPSAASVREGAAQTSPSSALASSAAPKARQPEANVADAVAHLSAGRYAHASRAYAALAERRPDAEVFRAITTILDRANDPRCKPGDGRAAACPEVLR
jgi:hypothetical protein